ncbi:GNAT family N-acetyltransferase [Pseudomonas carassii]|uniref:N-acetyltransferase domain-containing protein n=1 Tax=Pseudomonas carassii TaxID=3115855 RepID=A0ABU7H5P5_9PSED|nr:hypothetical protein [Pseudomonas sp. 137P]MEE1886605.1 hypothetical protein [Pseudomonas sp. 137P]
MPAPSGGLSTTRACDFPLSSLIQDLVPGQAHRIPVQVWYAGARMPALLEMLDQHHCLVDLQQNTFPEDHHLLTISYRQTLHHPALPVSLQVVGVARGRTRLTASLLSPRPDYLPADAHWQAPLLSASASSPVLFRRCFGVELGHLDPYCGEFRALPHDPGLLPGIDLELTLECRWSGTCRVRVQVTGVHLSDDQRSYSFRVLDPASSQALALLLLCQRERFSFDCLPAALRKSTAIDRLLAVNIVNANDLMHEVLACRLAANRHYGRLGDVESAWSLWDEFDPYSIHVAASLGSKCVGSGRVVVNDGHRGRCEIEVATPLPQWLWDAGFVEMSRVAIHPEYAGHRVMLALLRELGRITLHLRSRYIVLDAIEVLVPIYVKLGARCLPIHKQHPYSGERVRIMYFDVGQLLASLDRGLLHWLYVFGPTIEHSITPYNLPQVARTFQVRALHLRLKRGIASVFGKFLG